jgi:hypothetical protein
MDVRGSNSPPPHHHHHYHHQPLYPRKKNLPVPTEQEAEWATAPVWRGEMFPALPGVKIPDHPDRSLVAIPVMLSRLKPILGYFHCAPLNFYKNGNFIWGVFFSCLTDKRRPNALPPLRRTPQGLTADDGS